MSDLTQQLREQLAEAGAQRQPVQIRGGGSKEFLGRKPRGEPIELSGHRGVLSYQPKELVITARAGTPLAELAQLLAEHNQALPFEPPAYGDTATLGGTIACALSGPRRAFAGSARDYLLGARIINGKAELLRFGGEVMKNVAGYDISRLMCGAMGTLGLLLDLSLKVLPKPAARCSLQFECSLDEALAKLAELTRMPLPITASCWQRGWLTLRLEGAGSAVDACAKRIGGQILEGDDGFWDSVREQQHPAFAGEAPLWRLSLPPGAKPEQLPECQVVEWNGALRWSRSDLPEQQLRRSVSAVGGHATLWRDGDRDGEVFQRLPSGLWALHRNLKRAFDPQGLLNPGRLYADL